MKTIQPIQSWVNGSTVNCSILNAYVINDNLINAAQFYYALLSENENGTIGIALSQGNLTMTGEAYSTWQTNGQAWTWISTQLNLTIIGDYVPPVVEPIITEVSNVSE